MESMTVDRLINQLNGQWNIQLINSLFIAEDAQAIRRLPLICGSQDDTPIWRCSRNGVYSVKSAYFEITERITNNVDLRAPGQWRKLWNLKIPAKVKLLLWRMGRGVLPTRQNLQRRHVQCINTCGFCENYPESEWHVFYDCTRARQFWEESKLWPIIRDTVEKAEGFQEAFSDLLEKLPVDSSSEVAMGYWGLWRGRNAKIWNEEVIPVKILVEHATDLRSDWSFVRRRGQAEVRRPTMEIPLTWARPPKGFVKCNIDAAMFQEEGCFGVGMAVRDEDGRFLRAASVPVHGFPRVIEAEAYGLEKAIEWMNSLGFDRVVLEIDSKGVLDNIDGPLVDQSELGSIVTKCKNLLSFLPNYKVSLVRRQANYVAHHLARASKFFTCSQDFEYMPSFVSELIELEMK